MCLLCYSHGNLSQKRGVVQMYQLWLPTSTKIGHLKEKSNWCLIAALACAPHPGKCFTIRLRKIKTGTPREVISQAYWEIVQCTEVESLKQPAQRTVKMHSCISAVFQGREGICRLLCTLLWTCRASPLQLAFHSALCEQKSPIPVGFATQPSGSLILTLV